MTKRYRAPKAKPGELRACWGRVDRHSGPDLCYVWGAGIQSPDAQLLHSMLSCKQLALDFPGIGQKWEPSFIDELKARGYDITTLRFSIMRRAPGE